MEKDDIWTPDKPLAYLPPHLRNLFVQEAKYLYSEFQENISIIDTAPAPIQTHADHKIRVVESRNPSWYSGIYYSVGRGKRRLFKKALERIINEEDKDFNPCNNWYSYDRTIREVIYSRFVNGYNEQDGSFVFPNNEVRKFFKLDLVEIEEDEYLEEDTPFKRKKEYDDVVPF